jgi:hypothetical protein
MLRKLLSFIKFDKPSKGKFLLSIILFCFAFYILFKLSGGLIFLPIIVMLYVPIIGWFFLLLLFCSFFLIFYLLAAILVITFSNTLLRKIIYAIIAFCLIAIIVGISFFSLNVCSFEERCIPRLLLPDIIRVMLTQNLAGESSFKYPGAVLLTTKTTNPKPQGIDASAVPAEADFYYGVMAPKNISSVTNIINWYRDTLYAHAWKPTEDQQYECSYAQAYRSFINQEGDYAVTMFIQGDKARGSNYQYTDVDLTNYSQYDYIIRISVKEYDFREPDTSVISQAQAEKTKCIQN